MGLRAWREHRHYVNALSTIESLEKAPSPKIIDTERQENIWQRGVSRRDWLEKQAFLGKITSEAVDIEYVHIITPATVLQLPEQPTPMEIDLTQAEVAS